MRLKKLFTQLLFIIFTVVISSAVFASGDGEIAVVPGAKPISINEAEKLLGGPNIYFFDANVEEVRTQYGYIEGATLVDEMNWEQALPKDKNATIVFYCLNRLCTASSEIALQAQNNGYPNVYVMLDGIEGWITSGRVARKISEARWLSGSEVKDFQDGIHKELIFGVLPACRDCHGTEGIKVAVANSKDTINTNCSDCHKDVKEVFFKSVHGEKKDTGMPPGTLLFDNSDKPMMKHGAADKMGEMEKEKPKEQPICWDCHNVHATEKSAVFSIKMVSDEKCGSCHEKEQKRYYTTFHGKAMYLNDANSAPEVAACYDCHGTHNIYKVADNRSTLFGVKKIETCKECHDDSNAKFTGFIAHADHTDKKNYPLLWYAYVFMTGLIVIVFAFFGLHTFIWSIRLIAMRLRNPEAWKKARHAAHVDNVAIRRFQLFHRIQHFFMAASFLSLSFSGLPQKFYTAPWAQSMIEFMGGAIAATKIHHVSAIVMIIVFLSHIAEVCVRAWDRRDVIRDSEGKMKMMLFLKGLFGPDSLMPRWQDFKDFGNHVKWFFNKGPRPQFDRWTYWEKFDYLAVFWGMFIIGFSGLILWFPTFFTILLPGWMINLATLVHSDEALLATGFIFAVHFFNTHFRADRFPMDMVIFSGTITKEEMLQERVVWYDRLVKEGNLSRLSEENGRYNSYKWLARIIGIGMLLTGLVFLFLIIFALVTS